MECDGSRGAARLLGLLGLAESIAGAGHLADGGLVRASVDAAQVHVHEADESIACGCLGQPEDFASHGFTDKDPLALPLDLAVRIGAADLMRRVVDRLREVWPPSMSVEGIDESGGIQLVVAPPKDLTNRLAHIEGFYGGAAAYFESVGVSAAPLSVVRAKLVA